MIELLELFNNKDSEKNKLLQKMGISVFRVREIGLKKTLDCDYIYNYKSKEKVLVIKRILIYICNNYLNSIVEGYY